MAARRKVTRRKSPHANDDERTPPLNKWGVPDWRKKDAYGDTESWTSYRWRWEFYRRREDLREYFESRAIYIQAGIYPPSSPHWKERDDPGFYVIPDDEAKQVFGYSRIPNPRIGHQPAEIIIPLRDGKYQRLIVRNESEKESSPGDVKSYLKIIGPIINEFEELEIWSDFLDSFPVQISRHEAVFVFDLSKPLENQLNTARELFRELQIERYGKIIQRRQRPEKWLGYLRTLDARADGATWAEIASIHVGTRQSAHSARDIWNQARSLCFDF